MTQPFGMLKTYCVIVLTVLRRKHVKKNKPLCQLNAELWPHVFKLNKARDVQHYFFPKIWERETDWQIEREREGRKKDNERVFHITGGRAYKAM